MYRKRTSLTYSGLQAPITSSISAFFFRVKGYVLTFVVLAVFMNSQMGFPQKLSSR